MIVKIKESKEMKKALMVAKYFILLNAKSIKNVESADDIEQNEPMTHLKIQKLLYYANGLNLVYFNQPLFDNPIEAWKHGPVVREVYNDLSQYGKRDLMQIPNLLYTEDTLSDDERDIIEMAFREYGRYTALELRNMTHSEPTWIEAYQKGQNTPIDNEIMYSYFVKKQKQKAEIMYIKSKEYRCLFS